MTQYLPVACFYCRHYRGLAPDDGIVSRKLVCAAFPDGASSKFLSGRAVHTTPEPGDNGRRFEPRDEEEYRRLKAAWPERASALP